MHSQALQVNNLIPIKGAVGLFEYDVLRDVSTHDTIQKSIWGLIGDGIPFKSILSRVAQEYKTKFQEMVFQVCEETTVETAPFQLCNGIVVIDKYFKVFEEGGDLIKIIGKTEVVSNKEAA